MSLKPHPRSTHVQHEVKDEQHPEVRIVLENVVQTSLLFLELSCQIQKKKGSFLMVKNDVSQ